MNGDKKSALFFVRIIRIGNGPVEVYGTALLFGMFEHGAKTHGIVVRKGLPHKALIRVLPG